MSDVGFKLSYSHDLIQSGYDVLQCFWYCGNNAQTNGIKYMQFEPAYKQGNTNYPSLCKCYKQACSPSTAVALTGNTKYTVAKICSPDCPGCDSGKNVILEAQTWRVQDNLNYCTYTGSSGPNVGSCMARCLTARPSYMWFEFWPDTKKCICCDRCPTGDFRWPTTPDELKQGQSNPQNWTPKLKQGAVCTSGKDDPHFVGAHGTHYDFNGELDKVYCLVTDKRFHLNALFEGYKTENLFGTTVGPDGKGVRSWMRELGFVWRGPSGKSHKLRMVARGGVDVTSPGLVESVEIDSAPVALDAVLIEALEVDGLKLKFVGGTVVRGELHEEWGISFGNLAVLRLLLKPSLKVFRLDDDANIHFNIIFKKFRATPAVHGIIGQTYRNTRDQLFKAERFSAINRLMRQSIQADGDSGKGFLEGAVADYESSSIVGADCKFSPYAAQIA